jgi:hypothetical protein
MPKIKELIPHDERERIARQILFHPLVTEDDWRAVARLIDDNEAPDETEDTLTIEYDT